MISKLGIHIKTADIKKSYPFYKAFGFKAIFAYGKPGWLTMLKTDFPELPTAPEEYNGVTFELNNTEFELGEGHVAVKPEVFKERIHSSKVSAMIDAPVDEVVKICNENNFEIAAKPRIFHWGKREVVVKDPDGFILVFREPFKGK